MPRYPALSDVLTVAVLFSLPMASAWAQQAPPPARGNPPRSEEPAQAPPPRGSLSDAVRRVERSTRGEVLSAERVQYDGRDMHRVKVVDNSGRVRVFLQDPARRDDAPRTEPRPQPARSDDD